MKSLRHSAKGTTWDDHKYVAKKEGRYFYSLDDLFKWEENRKKADDYVAKSKLEEADHAEMYYRKAPDSVLGKVDWALGRLNRGMPLDNKEYMVCWQNGKKHLEALEDVTLDELYSEAAEDRKKREESAVAGTRR